MHQFTMFSRIDRGGRSLPTAHDPLRAAQVLEDWRKQCDLAQLPGLGAAADDPVGRAVLEAVFGNSPFLTQCLLKDLAFADRLMRLGPDAALAGILDEIAAIDHSAIGTEELKRGLREVKLRAALTIGLADITDLWTLDQVTAGLSDLAEGACVAACNHLLRKAAKKGDLNLPDRSNPSAGSGFTVIGMGKLGGRELNYSSDIDLIVLYDEELVDYTGRQSPQHFFVRLTQAFVAILQDRTSDGYVFRTDLRLRPDPGATPVALTMGAAEGYYGSIGQSWERAALIKARPVAGDLSAGADFLERISPFVWRRHLDFAAMQDIHAITRRIHAHHGHSETSLEGHDVKLGYGGIREIEFLAQSHQLIAGGREPRLRGRTTCGVLRRLAESGTLESEDVAELIGAYEFLRRLEHRLQMINDEQTHVLPASAEGMTHVAKFMGYANSGELTAALAHHLGRVRLHYGRLFEGDGDDGGGAAETQLAFEKVEADAASLTALAEMGFDAPQQVYAIVHGWHMGRHQVLRRERARGLLQSLAPRLLRAMARTAGPQAALLRFEELLGRLPAGIQFFSLLQANDWLLDLIAEIMGTAPRLAGILGLDTGLLDSLLSRDFHGPETDPRTLDEDLTRDLAQARHFEDKLDACRRWTNEQRFRIGIQVLRNTLGGAAAGRAQADVAEAAVRQLLALVSEEFAEAHDCVPGGGMAVLALGKLGGGELTFTSDLDLIFIYDTAPSAENSDGKKSLPPSTYYAKLSQRFISAMTTLGRQGRLYDVDMRLRPSGRAGPVALSLESFSRYQQRSAWTWEHLALTRARVIAGPQRLRAAVGEAVDRALKRPREAGRVAHDVMDMRARLDREFGTQNPWNIKYVRGGLLDLEFVVQCLQLQHADTHPAVLARNLGAALTRLEDSGLLAADVTADLIAAKALFDDVQSLIRLCAVGEFRDADAPAGLRHAVAAAGCRASIGALKQDLQDTQCQVYRTFEDIVGGPAAAWRAENPETDSKTADKE